MRILLTANKTLRTFKIVDDKIKVDKQWVDGNYWNVYIPLQNLGHDVYFYDTVNPEEKNFKSVVDRFKPDLIFCCLTNDKSIAPYEPWEEIQNYTHNGLTRTFNWFCDDTWRFEDFSKYACHAFNVCSTPEISYIERFKKDANYTNIILGLWHANMDLFPTKKLKKEHDISFCGQLNRDRAEYIQYLKEEGIEIKRFHGLEQKDMISTLAKSKIGINFSKNFNGKEPTLQIKGRMFEVPAARALLFTEYTPGLEEHYELDKEIVTFTNKDDMREKAQFLLKNPSHIAEISEKGHNRLISCHESKIRLKNIIKEVFEV